MTALPRVPWRVRDARRDDIAAIAATMADAFEHDPVMEWMFPDAATRASSLRAYFEVVQHHVFIPNGTVLTTEDRSGAAFWVRPGAWPLHPMNAQAFSRAMKTMFARRATLLDRGLAMMDERRPKRPHFYLAGIGTAHARQSRGIGTALIEPILRESDEIQTGIYLEASTSRNVALYERLGFFTVSELDLPGSRRVSGPHLWLMWRPAMP